MTAEVIAALGELARLSHSALDQALNAWRAGAGAGVRLWCGPGCENCCSLAVNATLPEALAIHAVLDPDRRAALADAAGKILAHARQSCDARAFLTGYRQAVGPCPFLDATGHCSIYPVRPLACRALLATRPPDWCGVNLAELAACDRDAFLASLDRQVVAFPTHYAAAPQELAAAGERDLLAAMQDSAGFALSGSLVFLTWVCGEAGFAASLAAGPDRVGSFFAGQGVDLPFLVQINIP